METTTLEGKILIAMPDIGDPRFDRAVILICAHSEEGAMGLIVNQTTPNITLGQLLDQLDIEAKGPAASTPIRIGGPVETNRGFVLHSGEYEAESALDVAGKFKLTGTVDILKDIARGCGPQDHMVALGYTGWAPGQLEDEMQRNGWLTADADAAIIFDTEHREKWARALGQLGITPDMLSSVGGSA